ncbi:ASCH domain-containing protein [Bacillus sp. NTK074B]|uniref:ASCH domain-containing protein n=1 Tax=Bacillus sp. NTK074B TaxID=2802174 RepID=UPI001A8FFDBE|nr:ASCH domain-containing protein [Bacillus sp. NTK074B]
MKGLIIRAPWIDYILKGEKTWEIRGSNTAVRGRVGLIKSGTGTVVGTVEIKDSIELTLEDYRENSIRHGANGKDVVSLPYKKTYAWVLDQPTLFDEPFPYKHPMGAVIWVNLSKAVNGGVTELLKVESGEWRNGIKSER